MSIKPPIKKFWKSKFNRYLLLGLIITGIIAPIITQEQNITTEEGLTVYFFYLPTCPHCTDQKPIIEELKQELTQINFYSYDASSTKGSQLFYQLSAEAGLEKSKLVVPTVFVGKHPLTGVHSKEQIKKAIEECKETCLNGGETTTQEIKTGFTDLELPVIGRTDLTKFSIPTLAIILGLIDGFNPCAMWVLIYLIGLLIGVADKRKIWLIVGIFVLSSGILYFLFMTAWLNLFLVIGYIQLLTSIIGLVALGGGIMNLKDYFSKKPLTCEIGDEKSHEKTMNKIKKIVSQPLSLAIIGSIILLAFIINSVEFVCSSAIPAVFTQILAINELSTLEHYLYILVYTFFFMLDDLIIFGLAAFAISTAIGNKYANYCKLIGGIILTILGALMVFAPHILR